MSVSSVVNFMDIKIAQQEAITELVLENQRLKRELGEVRDAFKVAYDERVQMEMERNEAVAARKASIEAGRRWRKVASAYEILTPPVGGKRIIKLAHRDGWQCAYCGVETGFTGNSPRRATVDHVVPKSKGGLDHLSNCVVACAACNAAKGDQVDWSPPEVDEPKSEIPKENLTTTERRGRREVEQPQVGPLGARLAGASESKNTEENPKTWEWRDGMFRKKKHEE